MPETGCLYIVPTPIGNLADITQRALETLASVDGVICEEVREGSTLLKRLGITPKEIISVNEHNEVQQAPLILQRMLLKGESFALISDCGTPVFADPGHELIRQAAEFGLRVVPLPGPSSLMAALSALDFKLTNFVFAGFMPRDPEQRRRELTRLRGLGMAMVLMDTPYRMGALLEDVIKVFGKGQRLTLVTDISLPGEKIYRGGAGEVRAQVGPRKAEFILILHGKP